MKPIDIANLTKPDEFEIYTEGLLEKGHSNTTIHDNLVERGVNSQEAWYIVESVQGKRVKQISRVEW